MTNHRTPSLEAIRESSADYLPEPRNSSASERASEREQVRGFRRP